MSEKVSEWVPVVSGTPEGGHISPLLFSLYVNDLPAVVSTNCLLFADELKLFHEINPRPAGVFSRTRPAGGGGRFCPPCLTPELIGAARRARRRSKALNEKIPVRIKNFL